MKRHQKIWWSLPILQSLLSYFLIMMTIILKVINSLSWVFRQNETWILNGLYFAVHSMQLLQSIERKFKRSLWQQCYGLLTCSSKFSFDQIAQHCTFERRISKTHLGKLYVATGNSSFLTKDFSLTQIAMLGLFHEAKNNSENFPLFWGGKWNFFK